MPAIKRYIFSFKAALLWVSLAACSNLSAADSPALLIVSLDGFRWDYSSLHPEQTPELRKLAADGSSAQELVPVFPSNTFPNHYTLATGLYPAHHGIINNEMFDPRRGEFFRYNTPAAAHDPYWWGGEPIWDTAVNQGRKSAAYFWPGSEATVGGVHATYFKPYNYAGVTFNQRIDQVVEWLQLPPAERPCVINFYIEECNSVGHAKGPESPELVQTIQKDDTEVGLLIGRIRGAGIPLNVIIVSDHGMTSTDIDRLIVIDDYISLDEVQVEFHSPMMGLRPLKGDIDGLVERLKKIPGHATVYRAQNLPARYHMTNNPRIPPVWVVCDEGWQVRTRAYVEQYRKNYNRGEHGYDPALKNMHGILIANGPSFKSGFSMESVENIHVYNLLCATLGLKPAPNDGDDRLAKAFLRNDQ